MRRIAKLSVVLLLLACSERKGLGGEEGASSDDATTASSDDGDEAASSTGGVEDMGTPDCAPILQMDGSPSGFEQCMSSGAIFRTSAEVCVNPFPPSDGNSCAYGTCFSDADCTDAPYGACELQGDFPAECNCIYGCKSDAECGPGFACMCTPVDDGTRCIEADCRSDADCSEGYRCELSPGGGWSWELASLHCHDPDDECQSDADCPDSACHWAGERWECVPGI